MLMFAVAKAHDCAMEAGAGCPTRDIKSLDDDDDSLHLMQKSLTLAAHRDGGGIFLDAAAAGKTADAYFWPSGRGRVGQYTTSPYAADWDLSKSLSWSWHDPKRRAVGSPQGQVIDDLLSIYLATSDGIHKFSSEGDELWMYQLDTHAEEIMNAPSLWNGKVYCDTLQGRVFALSMDTGAVVWSTQASDRVAYNNAFVNAYADTVIVGSDCCADDGWGGNTKITGLNATDGNILWKFKPDIGVWNFLPSYADDGTFIFQEYTGQAYRNRISDGTVVWKSGGALSQGVTWTDGAAQLGPNGIVYAVHQNSHENGHPGVLSAYNFTDGAHIWSQSVPKPPNNAPAIGHLAGHDGLSIVQPIGTQGVSSESPSPIDVYAFDALTGAPRWIFYGQGQKMTPHGEFSAATLLARITAGVHPANLPNPWSSPTIDANGTVFIGNEGGSFHALRDSNGDGLVEGDTEISTYHAESCFPISSGPALAPGLMAVSDFDSLYVFKTP